MLEYGYPAAQIDIEVAVEHRVPNIYADIFVYADKSLEKPLILVECKREDASRGELDQGYMHNRGGLPAALAGALIKKTKPPKPPKPNTKKGDICSKKQHHLQSKSRSIMPGHDCRNPRSRCRNHWSRSTEYAVAIDALLADGWRVLVVWECWLRATRDDEVAAEALAAWMRSGQSFSEFSGELVAVVDG